MNSRASGFLSENSRIDRHQRDNTGLCIAGVFAAAAAVGIALIVSLVKLVGSWL